MPEPAVHDAIDLARIRRALLVKLRNHGDVLLTSPVFTVLKHAAAQVDVDALVYLETPALLDRLENDGWPLVLTGAPDPAETPLVHAIKAVMHASVVDLLPVAQVAATVADPIAETAAAAPR
jgi:hypothetical protein